MRLSLAIKLLPGVNIYLLLFLEYSSIIDTTECALMAPHLHKAGTLMLHCSVPDKHENKHEIKHENKRLIFPFYAAVDAAGSTCPWGRSEHGFW